MAVGRWRLRRFLGRDVTGLASLTLLLTACGAADRPTAPRPVAPAEAGPAAPAAEPFDDVTATAGLDFVHTSGVSGRYFFPEITAAGAALFDYDLDGDLDVFLPQGFDLGAGGRGAAGRLYRNDLRTSHDGTRRPVLVDVTAESGIAAHGYGQGAAVADVDGDGLPDLYLTNFGPNQLWRNLGGGRFGDISGLSGTDAPEWSVSASFADIDRDGDLDLYVANYVLWDLERHRPCYAPNSAQDYCGPQAYAPQPDRLYRNLGDGRFEDVSETSGVSARAGPGLGVVATDLDGDTLPDFYVANDGAENFLWHNLGGGRFEERALLAGCAVNQAGSPEAGMGVEAADLDGDGVLDLFLSHLGKESNTLYRGLAGGVYDDASVLSGLAAPSLPWTGFGTRALDYDNDGWLDLVVVNGAVYVRREQFDAGVPRPFREPNMLLRNLGEGRFEVVPAGEGSPFARFEVSRGLAVGDLDNDGDSDLLVSNNDGPARLLLNRVGQDARWLGLRLLDRRGHAIHNGAMLRAELSDGRVLLRRYGNDGSYASASDPRVILGLGENAQLVVLEVRWPDGTKEHWGRLEARRYHDLRQGGGRARESR